MSNQIFKMHIAQDLNHILKELDWRDRVCRGILINANDITDQMVAQIEHAMTEEKKIPHQIRTRFGITRRKITFDLYHEILYNDILSHKELL